MKHRGLEAERSKTWKSRTRLSQLYLVTFHTRKIKKGSHLNPAASFGCKTTKWLIGYQSSYRVIDWSASALIKRTIGVFPAVQSEWSWMWPRACSSCTSSIIHSACRESSRFCRVRSLMLTPHVPLSLNAPLTLKDFRIKTLLMLKFCCFTVKLLLGETSSYREEFLISSPPCLYQ